MPNEMDGVFDKFLEDKFKEFGVPDLNKLKYKTDLADMDWLNGVISFKEFLEAECVPMDELFEEWIKFMGTNILSQEYVEGARGLSMYIEHKFVSNYKTVIEARNMRDEAMQQWMSEKQSNDAEIRRICDELEIPAHDRNIEAILKKIRLFTKNQDSGKL